jgi:hypothetical protein
VQESALFPGGSHIAFIASCTEALAMKANDLQLVLASRTSRGFVDDERLIEGCARHTRENVLCSKE